MSPRGNFGHGFRVTQRHREPKGAPTDLAVRRPVVVLCPDAERDWATVRGPATAGTPLSAPALFESGQPAGETHGSAFVSRWRSRSSSSPEVRTVTITRATAAIACAC